MQEEAIYGFQGGEHDNHMEIKIIMLLCVFFPPAFATQSQGTSFQWWTSKGKVTLQAVALHLLGLRKHSLAALRRKNRLLAP